MIRTSVMRLSTITNCFRSKALKLVTTTLRFPTFPNSYFHISSPHAPATIHPWNFFSPTKSMLFIQYQLPPSLRISTSDLAIFFHCNAFRKQAAISFAGGNDCRPSCNKTIIYSVWRYRSLQTLYLFGHPCGAVCRVRTAGRGRCTKLVLHSPARARRRGQINPNKAPLNAYHWTRIRLCSKKSPHISSVMAQSKQTIVNEDAPRDN